MKRLLSLLLFACLALTLYAQQQVINVGTVPNDRTGDSARVAGQKINANFTALFGTSIQASLLNTNAVLINSGTNFFTVNAALAAAAGWPTNVNTLTTLAQLTTAMSGMTNYVISTSTNGTTPYNLAAGTNLPLTSVTGQGFLFQWAQQPTNTFLGTNQFYLVLANTNTAILTLMTNLNATFATTNYVLSNPLNAPTNGTAVTFLSTKLTQSGGAVGLDIGNSAIANGSFSFMISTNAQLKFGDYRGANGGGYVIFDYTTGSFTTYGIGGTKMNTLDDGAGNARFSGGVVVTNSETVLGQSFSSGNAYFSNGVAVASNLNLGTKTNIVVSTNVISIVGGYPVAQGTYTNVNAALWTNGFTSASVSLAAGTFYIQTNGVSLYSSSDIKTWALVTAIGGLPSGAWGSYWDESGVVHNGAISSTNLDARFAALAASYIAADIVTTNGNAAYTTAATNGMATNQNIMAFQPTSLWASQGNLTSASNTLYGIAASGGAATNAIANNNGKGTNTMLVNPSIATINANSLVVGSNTMIVFNNGGNNNILLGYSNVLGQNSDINVNFDSMLGGTSNVIGNFVTYSTLAGGWLNYLSDGAASSFLGGGKGNILSADYSALVGGQSNAVSGASSYDVINGGQYNIISNAFWSVIGGGLANFISQAHPNANDNSFIGAGQGNKIEDGEWSAIVGGRSNYVTTTGNYGFIGGGYSNTVSGAGGVAAGGYYNVASGLNSVALGQSAIATNGSFTFSDSSSTTQFGSSTNNQFLVRAQNGVGINTNSAGTNALRVAGNVDATSFTGDGSRLVNVPNGSPVVLTNFSAYEWTNLQGSLTLGSGSQGGVIILRDQLNGTYSAISPFNSSVVVSTNVLVTGNVSASNITASLFSGNGSGITGIAIANLNTTGIITNNFVNGRSVFQIYTNNLVIRNGGSSAVNSSQYIWDSISRFTNATGLWITNNRASGNLLVLGGVTTYYSVPNTAISNNAPVTMTAVSGVAPLPTISYGVSSDFNVSGLTLLNTPATTTAGAFTGTFTGDGSGLTNVSGTGSSPNSLTNYDTRAVILTNPASSFSGNGAGLTNLQISALPGSGWNISGTFTGDGGGLTNIGTNSLNFQVLATSQVAILASNNVFTASNAFTGGFLVTNASLFVPAINPTSVGGSPSRLANFGVYNSFFNNGSYPEVSNIVSGTSLAYLQNSFNGESSFYPLSTNKFEEFMLYMNGGAVLKIAKDMGTNGNDFANFYNDVWVGRNLKVTGSISGDGSGLTGISASGVTNFYSFANAPFVGGFAMSDGTSSNLQFTAAMTNFSSVAWTNKQGSLNLGSSGNGGNLYFYDTADNTTLILNSFNSAFTVSTNLSVKGNIRGSNIVANQFFGDDSQTTNKLVGMLHGWILSPLFKNTALYYPVQGGTGGNATEAICAQPFAGGRLTNLYIQGYGIIAGTNCAVTVMTNGIASAITANFNGAGAAQVYASDITHGTFTLTNGAPISIKILGNNPSASAATIPVSWSLEVWR